ncbi:type I-D CRISPR-associated helicase Cas3' [Haloferax sp. KTX1]|uniref:type I-D CRISPR-associated helicase Cas3' n=1 Tax=Haloferax sp. KTX1 TaxID=2600597 RepID=UPI0011DD2EF6|nr:type I-D CRISPR-associated helicase Cas3' [Haloferax sp. KTX1]
MNIAGASLATAPPRYDLAERGFPHARQFQNEVAEWAYDGSDPVAVLRAPTGAGKTATFHSLINARDVPLIVYPTNALLRQQQSRFEREGVGVGVLTSDSLRGHGNTRVEQLLGFFDSYQHDFDVILTNPDILQAAIQGLYQGSKAMRIFDAIKTIVFDEFHFYDALAASGLLLQTQIIESRHADAKVLLASATPNEDFVDFVRDRLGLSVRDINAEYVDNGDQFRHSVEVHRHEDRCIRDQQQAVAESLRDELNRVDGYDEPHAVVVFNSVKHSNDFHQYLHDEYPDVFEHTEKDNGFDTNDVAAALDDEDFYILNTTSKGEVGLDYDIRLMHMENPGRAGPFLQRFGRAGRKSPATVHVYGLGQGPWGDDVSFPTFETQIYEGLNAYERADGRRMPLNWLGDLVGFRGALALITRESDGRFDQGLKLDFAADTEYHKRWRGFIYRVQAELDEVATGFDPGKYTPVDPEAKLLEFTAQCFKAFHGLRGRSVNASVKYPRGDRTGLTTYGLTTILRYYDIEAVEYRDDEPVLLIVPRSDDSLSVVTAQLPGYESQPTQYNRPTTKIEEELQTKLHREICRVEDHGRIDVSIELLHRFFKIVRITDAVVPKTITTAQYEIEIKDDGSGPPTLSVQERQR